MDFQEVILSPEVIWFIVGLVLLSIELLGGFTLTIGFFGVGAWVTSIACMFDDIEMRYQMLIFASFSVVSLVLLRRMIKRHFFDEGADTPDTASKEELSDEYIGQRVEAETDFGPGKAGRVTFKGATWKAMCDKDVHKGDQLRITDIESITLYVEPV